MKQFYTHPTNLSSYKRLIVFAILLCCATILKAQPRSAIKKSENLKFGFKAGAVYTWIIDLSKVLVSESYYTGYTFEDNSQWGFTAGVFLNYKFDETILKKVI